MSFLKNIFGKEVKESVVVELDTQYTAFWDWFVIYEAEFLEVIKNNDGVVEKFIDVVGPKLKEINPNFNMLTGMGKDGVGELIITPDGALKALPFVDDLVAVAPDLVHWRFISCKPSMKGIGLDMNGFLLDEETVSFIPIYDKDYPDYIHLRFIVKECTLENESDIGNALYMFLDNYLGEEKTMTMIDYLEVKGEEGIEGEVISVTKLSDYLSYREAEFVEKYDSIIRINEADEYSVLESNGDSGRLIVVVNTTFLNWDQKMSYPWVVKLSIKYNGKEEGMPSTNDLSAMDEIEDLLLETELLNSVARETGANERTLFFATKDYRNASREVLKTVSLFTEKFDIDYTIYRDKYWMGLGVYTNAVNKG